MRRCPGRRKEVTVTKPVYGFLPHQIKGLRMESIRLLIDGKEITASSGQTVLEAALASNIYIPHLCRHPDLPVQGNCNLCIVETGDDGRTVKACETPVLQGMSIRTKSPALAKSRNISMELMLAGHPKDCTSCKVYLNCELQSLMQYLGTVSARMRHIHREAIYINTRNPLIVREMERCVQCGRCVRACRELRGADVLEYRKLGWETYIGTANDASLADAGCRFCGACIEVCPTGALCDTEGLYRKDVPRREALVPCGAECPANIDVPRYIRYIRDGELSKAVAVIREKAPFPHTLGYVCNHHCEAVCKRKDLSGAVPIQNLKRYAAQHDDGVAWYERYTEPPSVSTGRSVAIIGSGPCGLTAAYYLNRKGHEVTVFERLPIAGGMMTTVMPEYRIPGDVVIKEIEYIRESGVKILTDHNVASASALKAEYDAVLVAVGAGGGRMLRSVPGWDSPGVFTAVGLLRSVRLGKTLSLGDTVNIIGGGNVAYDCARTLLRMGKRVNIVCLEKRADMPADEEEVIEAAEEGACLYDGCVSLCIESEDGKITGHRIVDVAGFSFDENRDIVMETVPGSERTLPCGSVVFAAGQQPEAGDGFGLELNGFGYPVVDADTLSTSVEGVFAAGDIVTGTKYVIDAIAGGRKAAVTIDCYLGGDGNIDEALIPYQPGPPKIGRSDGFAKTERAVPALRQAGERVGDFLPVGGYLDCECAANEARRCLQCDLRKQITGVRLWTSYAAGDAHGVGG